jgi:hypothetical protein
VVEYGAKQKAEDWNPEENGGYAIHGKPTIHLFALLLTNYLQRTIPPKTPHSTPFSPSRKLQPKKKTTLNTSSPTSKNSKNSPPLAPRTHTPSPRAYVNRFEETSMSHYVSKPLTMQFGKNTDSTRISNLWMRMTYN